MKYLVNGLIATVMCLTVSLQAYIYDFSNHSHHPVKLRLHLYGDFDEWYERVIPPKQNRAWRWTLLFDDESYERRKSPLCLENNIEIATPVMTKKTTIDEDGNEKVTYVQDNNRNGKPKWNPWRSVIITWIKDEMYEAIVRAGDNFADGAVEAATAIATAATGVPIKSFKVSGMTNAISTWNKYSLCTKRHFDIIEDADYSSKTEKSFVVMAVARN